MARIEWNLKQREEITTIIRVRKKDVKDYVNDLHQIIIDYN